MKKLVVLSILCLTACGTNSGNTKTTGNQLTGTWNVTVSQSGQSPVNLSAYIVGSQCSIAQSGDTFTVSGPACVVADNPSGIGHVSSQNSSLVPEGVLIGSPANPASDGTSINFLYAAVDSSNNLYVFSGIGTVSGGQMSGTWSCYQGMAICSGWTGTFSATRV